ncbi:hypothetical protein L5515_015770 [Caenorhabditis briggsae]|uniref:Uncharacterized protein n=1 Tax=Caenorhabditis briggsae TaxID=6238 RepID=A0AAE9J9Q0_CAEBR|nr:hypothetical protein L5515_015770 [Caenorhabditis briggsae]
MFNGSKVLNSSRVSRRLLQSTWNHLFNGKDEDNNDDNVNKSRRSSEVSTSSIETNEFEEDETHQGMEEIECESVQDLMCEEDICRKIKN